MGHEGTGVVYKLGQGVTTDKFKLGDVNEAFAQAEWHQRQTPVTRAVLVP